MESVNQRAERAREWVRQLTHFQPRFAGTPSERAAAEAVGRWLQQLGFADVFLTGVASAPRAGLVIAAHTACAFVGLWLAGHFGTALVLVAAISFFSETRRQRPLLARLMPAELSVNVVGRTGAPTPRQRVVLSAHIDAAQAGLIFSRAVADAFAGAARSRRPGGAPRGPSIVPEVAVGGAALLAVASFLGAHGLLFAAVHLLTSLLLLTIAVLTLQWALSPATPGANDNASAVAAMLTAAERLKAELPEEVELWVVGTGAEEVGCCGMKAFVQTHRDWPTDTTWYVNFECVGGGRLHYIVSEGLAHKTHYPPVLLEIARRLSARDRFGDVSPTALMAGTDGNVPAGLGYPTLSLITLEDNGVPRNYHRREDVVEAIDPNVVVRAADLGVEVALRAIAGEAGPMPPGSNSWQEPY